MTWKYAIHFWTCSVSISDSGTRQLPLTGSGTVCMGTSMGRHTNAYSYYSVAVSWRWNPASLRMLLGVSRQTFICLMFPDMSSIIKFVLRKIDLQIWYMFLIKYLENLNYYSTSEQNWRGKQHRRHIGIIDTLWRLVILQKQIEIDAT